MRRYLQIGFLLLAIAGGAFTVRCVEPNNLGKGFAPEPSQEPQACKLCGKPGDAYEVVFHPDGSKSHTWYCGKCWMFKR